MTLVKLLYPDGQRKDVILAGVPHVGETIRLNGRGEPLLTVEHVLWMESANGHEPVALVSVRPVPPH